MQPGLYGLYALKSWTVWGSVWALTDYWISTEQCNVDQTLNSDEYLELYLEIHSALPFSSQLLN